MCFNVNTQYLRRFFSLRFVRACVCSDLDLCHVSELGSVGSRQMGSQMLSKSSLEPTIWLESFFNLLQKDFLVAPAKMSNIWSFPGDFCHHHLLCSYVHCWHHRHQDQNQKILGAVCQLPGGAQMSTPWWLCHCHRHCGPTIIIITTTTIILGTTSIVIT